MIYCCIYLDNFFFESFNFLDLLLDIIPWNLFEFNLILNFDSFLNLGNNLWNILLNSLLNNFLNNLSNRLNLYTFSVDIDWDCSFNIDWNRNLNWLEDNSINKLNFSFLNWNSDYFINMHSYRNLLLLNHYSFFNHLVNLNIGSCLKIFH